MWTCKDGEQYPGQGSTEIGLRIILDLISSTGRMFYNRVFSRCFRAHDKVLNDQLAFGKYNNRTLKYSSNIKHYYIANFYFSSNQGSCASQVKSAMMLVTLKCRRQFWDVRHIYLILVLKSYAKRYTMSPKFKVVTEIFCHQHRCHRFWFSESNINRPTLHFLCGNTIDNLTIFDKTSDFKNHSSKCLNDYGTDFYSPENSVEALEIFEKYREWIHP